MTWADWITRHATLFGLQSEADLAMLREFALLFAEEGRTPADLAQATRDLALQNPPRFRTDHLHGLHAVLQARSALETAVEPSEGEIGPPEASCAICGGAGMIADLPSPDSLQRGRWTTCAARCDCAIGAWIGRHQGSRVLISLADYESLVPDWRERSAARLRELRAWHRARRTATQLDRVMGELLERVRQRGDQT